MDTCTIETGLLRKKPCGHPAVAHCLNCEQALCSQHAVAQKSESGSNTGKFLCKECEAAWKEQVKNIPKAEAKKPPEKPAGAPAHGAAPTAHKPAAAPPAVKKAAEAKPAEAKAPEKPAESSGMIEFTPTKKP